MKGKIFKHYVCIRVCVCRSEGILFSQIAGMRLSAWSTITWRIRNVCDMNACATDTGSDTGTHNHIHLVLT